MIRRPIETKPVDLVQLAFLKKRPSAAGLTPRHRLRHWRPADRKVGSACFRWTGRLHANEGQRARETPLHVSRPRGLKGGRGLRPGVVPRPRRRTRLRCKKWLQRLDERAVILYFGDFAMGRD